MVVPVYNPGPYFERTIRSLLTQTLPRSDYEVVLVDDGSTDGTAQRLDRAAAENPDLIRVTHIPHSGWPGRPRNVGTDLAAFDYVFYCDADDWLPGDSLLTLLTRAKSDRSDLVVSRAIGNRRAVPYAIFERGDYCTDWRRTPGVFSNLTTQKLFRRDFLRQRNLRFAEGKVRLEDFIFMTQALLQAERISVLGSTPCYVLEKRDDRGNLTATLAGEQDYYRSIEHIIDIIDANTAAGSERDTALNRVLASELIGSASSAAFLRKDEALRAQVISRVADLLDRRIPPSAESRLDARGRRLAVALRRADRDFVERLAASEAAVKPRLELVGTAWEDARLRMDLRAALVSGRGVVRLHRVGDRLIRPAGGGVGDGLDVTDELRRTAVHLCLRSRDNGEEWRVRAEVAENPDDGSSDRVDLCWAATAMVDFATVAGGRPLRPGLWDVRLQVGSCGLRREGQLLAKTVEEPAPAVLDGLAVSPFRTESGHLSVDVGQWRKSLAAEVVRRGVRSTTISRSELRIALPLMSAGSSCWEVHLLPRGGRGDAPRVVAGPLSGSAGGTDLRVTLPGGRAIHRWSVRLRFGGPGSGPTTPAGLRVLSTPLGYRIAPGSRWTQAVRRLLAHPVATRIANVRNEVTRIGKSAGRTVKSSTWQRRALTLSTRLGLNVRDLGPGVAVVSRREREVHTMQLKAGVTVSGLGKEALRAAPLTDDAWLLEANKTSDSALDVRKIGERGWLVARRGKTSDSVLDVSKIGERGWLVASRDRSPEAELTLETDTLQHVASRHAAWLLSTYGVDCVFDVGANSGQYGAALRRHGYRGHIVSFEPVPRFADHLEKSAADDDKWMVHRMALGTEPGTVSINVQRTFSSLLPSSEYGKHRFATLRDLSGTQQVDVPLRRLDEIFDDLLRPVVDSGVEHPRVFLKMDTQGFDLEVFRGLGERVQDVVGLQSEVALLLIYEQMPRMPEAIMTYEQAGFEISGLFPVTREPDGRVIEYDCIMVRASSFRA